MQLRSRVKVLALQRAHSGRISFKDGEMWCLTHTKMSVSRSAVQQSNKHVLKRGLCQLPARARHRGLVMMVM